MAWTLTPPNSRWLLAVPIEAFARQAATSGAFVLGCLRDMETLVCRVRPIVPRDPITPTPF